MGKRDRSVAGEEVRAIEAAAGTTDVINSDELSNSAESDVIISVSRRVVALLCFVVFGPWLLVTAAVFWPQPPSLLRLPMDVAQTTVNSNESVNSVEDVEPLPECGRLNQTRITISPPTEFIEELDISNVGSDWHFSNVTSAGVDELLASFGIEKSVRDELAELSKSSIDEVVHVTNEVLRKIPIQTRAKVYRYLSQDRRNVDQYYAFRFCSDSVDDWFLNSKLRPELVERIKSMVYSNGPVLFFSDLRLILPELQSEWEREQVLKTLSRESTRLVRLRVNKGSNIDSLIDYWGRRGRAKDVRPILESLALRFKGGDIDIVHLFPPFARERIYTYPGTANENMVVNRDAYWTALNFFNEKPDDRYASLEQVGAALQSDYYPILGAPKFGDLVCFTDENGDLFHSAVYVADDLLFTKNGKRVSRPWMLMSTDEMIHFYPRREPPVIRYFRRQDS